MNFNFADKINPYLSKLDFEKALTIAETELRRLPITDFHDVLNKSLIDQTDDLVSWIDNFYNMASAENKVKAMYFEMNEFDINTSLWFIDGFAFSTDGGLDVDDMDWLSDYDTDSQTETGTVFIIKGYEKLQQAFNSIEGKKQNGAWSNEMQDARDWCEQIVIIRFMELMASAHKKAKEQNLKWGKIPLYCTEHSYDFVIKSGKKK